MLNGNLDVDKDINADIEAAQPMTPPLEQYALLRDAACLFGACLVILSAAAILIGRAIHRPFRIRTLCSYPQHVLWPFAGTCKRPVSQTPPTVSSTEEHPKDAMRLFGSDATETRQAENICHELPTLDKRPTVRPDQAGRGQGIRNRRGAERLRRLGGTPECSMNINDRWKKDSDQCYEDHL